ncbi:phosphate-starvation-inducible PsiE family protein [Iningainema tapete]|uniref:Phosphate-starvation-inducible PsiE family protein n=1 Tax=Iningainema tapete BLCC-T55 TaxID=2748662 RepID=A0A8J6XFV0_9CYAN|nr:phosphate-starvation-inducible PsiE family protein [Iningainema tapete]MBD2771762.1 phosphate-starvation-inducible PsiE family protein [Iningainema tapete BLCC-T55]
MQESLNNQLNQYEILKRTRIVRCLETVQDLIIISLCIGLFSFMAIELRAMFYSLLPPLDFKVVTSDILFLLILVELFRLLIIYLQEQRISIGVAVEVSIVSVLREVLVRGVLEASWSQILAACAFLLVMGILLIVRVWIPPTFSGIDPERQLSMRNKYLATGSPHLEAQEISSSTQNNSRVAANMHD